MTIQAFSIIPAPLSRIAKVSVKNHTGEDIAELVKVTTQLLGCGGNVHQMKVELMQMLPGYWLHVFKTNEETGYVCMKRAERGPWNIKKD